MKKTIKGKSYDTKTAEHICTYNIKDTGTIHLYRKKTGEYFAWRSMTQPWAENETIKPLTWQEANEISVKAGNGNLKSSISAKSAITIRISDDMYIALAETASRTGVSITEIVNLAIKDFLKMLD